MLLSNLKSSRYGRFAALTIPVVVLLCLLAFTWDPLPGPLPRPPTPQQTPASAQPPHDASRNSIPTSRPVSAAPAGDVVGGAISGITDKIWQSAKNPHLSDDQHDWIDTWFTTNPSFRYELLTDASAVTFVRTHYAMRPDIIEVFETLPIPILRADLLRYLLVLAEGGIWSDLDVTCDKPVAEWVPPEYKDDRIEMIVGLEFDFEWRGEGTPIASQFCNWVFAAPPSSRVLQVVVDAVVAKIKEIAALNRVPIKALTLEMLPIDVVDVTGPKIMTIAVLESLRQLLGRTVDDRDFHAIKKPKLIGDVLIMPGVSFAAAQNGYPDDQGDALVTHHYAGSWKAADAEAKEKKKQTQNGGQSA
ncbi:glycosyltransferase family 32 protein [Aspergillus carbonarius ITEM 5010]|uniref:Glycosyltransferase family 32 protein n=1 Tax=Aspergillus carbonarius (strain ITEM 5010) TaxID=602072 RepID=A0A1R3RN11_ASPC5|nr:glycosyltransferase family 32 protein [Aspergillus carbonarius ITEM 5010]